MKLNEANDYFNTIINIPFGNLFSENDMASIIRNKGRSGQLLELALGLNLSITNRDFEDGELKTNKCDSYGNPLETIAITQIASHIDDLITRTPFKETWLFEKISNILYVPVNKEDKNNPQNWTFLPSIHVDYNNSNFSAIYDQLEKDYDLICAKIQSYCEFGDNLHTTNGKYLQIRTKDSAPYHPIYSTVYHRNISNKNFAFYFKKDFINDIKALS